MSDFERFSFACENIGRMTGSSFKKEFLHALECDCGEELSALVLLGRENQKKLWRMVNGSKNEEALVEFPSLETFFNIDDSQPQNLNSLLFKGDLANHIDAFAESLGESVAIDLSGLKYLRPDEYHCNLTYQKLRKGEKCGGKEVCALVSFVACRAMMKRKIRLYLIADENMETAEKVLSLFDGRGLDADIHLCFYPSEYAVRKAAELCLNAPKKNISSEIILSEENNNIENIRELFSEIPASRIFLCKFLSSGKGKHQFEKMVKTISQEK